MPDGNNIPGHIVISATGRDAGHAYVVLGWYKPQTLLVADGRGRTVSNPKKRMLSILNSLTLLLTR